jgi:hypothetical protein
MKTLFLWEENFALEDQSQTESKGVIVSYGAKSKSNFS